MGTWSLEQVKVSKQGVQVRLGEGTICKAY